MYVERYIPSSALKALMLFENESLRCKFDITETSRQMSDLRREEKLRMRLWT